MVLSFQEMCRYAWSFIVVFVASACILVVEIVASRLLSPYVGVSLYTWTSIIGVVLAGISFGNYAGGYLADKFPTKAMPLLGTILLLAAMSTVVMLSQLPLFAGLFKPVSPLMLRVALLSAFIFLVPSVLMGSVNPVVIKLNLNDMETSGNVVGSVFALSTAGSLLGVFLTGFVLIERFGVRSIVYGVSVILVALALTTLIYYFVLKISSNRETRISSHP